MNITSPMLGVRKGSWTEEEDILLRKCIKKYGEGKWHLVPARAGLNRCRKSCRLRWLNYLRPHIKRGDFAEDEIDLIFRLHKLLGNRWSLIAGRLPGRTANDVKNYWNTRLLRKFNSIDPHDRQERRKCKANAIIKPQPRKFKSAKKNVSWCNNKSTIVNASKDNDDIQLWTNIVLENRNDIEEAAAERKISYNKNIMSSEENCNEIDKTPSLLNGGGQSDGWDEFSLDDIWNLLK